MTNQQAHDAPTSAPGKAGGGKERPPWQGGPALWRVLVALALGLALLAAGAIWSGPLRGAYGRLYRAVGGGGPPPASQPAQQQWFTCGMHPWVVLPRPGNCPICHMQLVRLDLNQFTGEIAINPLITQNIGVRVAPVVAGPVTMVIRTVATVDYDETRVREVNTKVGGWVEKLYADYVGQPVRKGQSLFDLYSPELYAAQQEYLVALRDRGKVPSEFLPAPDLVEAARKRLEYLDISPEQIQALEKSGRPSKTMTIHSPFTGLVTAKSVFEGMRIEPGMQLYRLADLSVVWGMVSLYEHQLPYVRTGQPAVMTLSYIPGQTFEGKVIYIYPYLSPESRQAKLRLEFANPDLLLKPGMFASVELRSTLAQERTLAPREAVVDTGLRQVAFVSLGGGRFQPRQVRLGVQAEGDMVEILEGLKPGEMVVTSGQFLLDSESNRREFLAKLIRGTPAAEPAAAAPAAVATELKSLPAPAGRELAALLEAYFQIGERLYQDSTDLDAPARALAAAAEALTRTDLPENPHFWHQHAEPGLARAKALELVGLKDLPSCRERFADLSVAVGRLLRATGVPAELARQVLELHCPMYREGQGGNIWLQAAGEVHNPFFGRGSGMARCFDRVASLPGVGGTPATAPATLPAAEPLGQPPAEGAGRR